jgi:uncharacterized protein (TIGR03437 family)
MTILRVTSLVFALALTGSAVPLTLATSLQQITFTGTGVNTSGAGTSSVSWGTCTYNGTVSTCVVSGSYTAAAAPAGTTYAVGTSGTYTFTLTYQGNGPAPLQAIASPPGSNEVIFQFTANGASLTFTATPTGGSPIPFYDLNENFQFASSASCTGVSNCSVGAVGMSNGGTITGPVIGTFDPTPVITNPNGLISASSYGGFTTIAPATWIEIYGTNLATVQSQTWSGTDFNGVNAPTALGGTKVTVDGLPAYIDYVSPNQVNAQVPSGVGTGSQAVVVTTAGGASSSYFVTVNATEPGLLAPSVFHLAAGQYAVALASNGTTYILPPGTTNSVPTAVCQPGDTIILFGIGFGAVNPIINAGVIVGQANSLSGFTAAIGGQQAPVQFAGLVAGFLGLYQFNIVVPNVPANNATPLTFALNGVSGTQQLLLAVGN